MSNTSEKHTQVCVVTQAMNLISIDSVSYPHKRSSSYVFHFAMSCLAYQHLFCVRSRKGPRQLSFLLPTVQTKCLLPTILKNYRVRTKKTFIFIAFQIPPALYMREISARTVFL